MITSNRTAARRAEPTGILRWSFVKLGHVITCEIRTNGLNEHDVCVVPHWNIGASIVERHDRVIGAFERHAEIISSLRQTGWKLLRAPDGLEAGAAA